MIDLSSASAVRGAHHWTVPINQLYHPTGELGQDQEELVYASDNLNTTKFAPILLKEWFFLVKKEGYLVIDYQPNKLCDWQGLEKQMWWLWKHQYEIIHHGAVSPEETRDLTEDKLKNFIRAKEAYFRHDLKGETLLPEPLKTVTEPFTHEGFIRFVCKKTKSTLIPGDDMGKWSFGVITNGTRTHWLEETIGVIRKMKIPNYEIIVCGTYQDRHENDVRCLPFNQRDDKIWITRKKNLIAESARYQNLCIFHDRVLFDEGWYEGMKAWGNCFETLSVVQLSLEDKKRYGDWGAMPGLLNEGRDFRRFYPLCGGALEYRDWDKSVYGYGVITIIKKNIFLNNPLNETLYWGDFEDLVLSKEFTFKGVLLRMNPAATVYSRTKSVFVISNNCEYNPLQLGKVQAPLWQRAAHTLLYLLGIRIDSKIFNAFKPFIKKYYKLTTHKDFKK